MFARHVRGRASLAVAGGWGVVGGGWGGQGGGGGAARGRAGGPRADQGVCPTGPAESRLIWINGWHHAKLLTSSRRASNNSFGGSPCCSQITRTIGSVWLTRTWNQRPGQSTRRPSSTFTRPSL